MIDGLHALSHWERCVVHVRDYARSLADSKVNASAVEGLLQSFLDAPAFYADWRSNLLRFGINVFERRRAGREIDDGRPAP
jgi:hypothetical protein